MSTGVILTDWERVDRIKIESELTNHIEAANKLVTAGISDQESLKKARKYHLSLENAARSKIITEQLDMELYFDLLQTIFEVNEKIMAQIRASQSSVEADADSNTLNMVTETHVVDETKDDDIDFAVDMLSEADIEHEFAVLEAELAAQGLLDKPFATTDDVPDLAASRTSTSSYCDFSDFEDLEYDDDESMASADYSSEDDDSSLSSSDKVTLDTLDITVAALAKELKDAGLLADDDDFTETVHVDSTVDNTVVVEQRKALGYDELKAELAAIYKESRSGDLETMQNCLVKLNKLYDDIFADDETIQEKRYKLADIVFDTHKEILAHCRHLSRSVETDTVTDNANFLQVIARKILPKAIVPRSLHASFYGSQTVTHDIDVKKGNAIRQCLISLEAHAISFADDYSASHKRYYEAKSGEKLYGEVSTANKFRRLASIDANDYPEYKNHTVEALVAQLNDILPSIVVEDTVDHSSNQYAAPVQFAASEKAEQPRASQVVREQIAEDLKLVDELLESFAANNPSTRV